MEVKMAHSGQQQMENLAKRKPKKKKQKKYKHEDDSNAANSKNSLDKSGIDSSFAERHMERNTDLHGTKIKKKKKHQSETDSTQNTELPQIGKDTGNITEEIKADHKEMEWPYVADWDLDEQGNVHPGQKQQKHTDVQRSSKKKHKPKKHKQTEAVYSPISANKQSPNKQRKSKKLKKQNIQEARDTTLINSDNGSKDTTTSHLLENDESEKKNRMDRKKNNSVVVPMLKSPDVKKPRYENLESHYSGIEIQSKESAFDRPQNGEDQEQQESEPSLEEDAQKLPKKKRKRKKNKHRTEFRQSPVDDLMTADITKSSEYEGLDVSLANKHQRMPVSSNKQPKLKSHSQGNTSDSELSTSSISTTDNIGHNNLPLNTTKDSLVKDRKGHNAKKKKAKRKDTNRNHRDKQKSVFSSDEFTDLRTKHASSSELHTDGNDKRRKRKNNKPVFKSSEIKKSRHEQYQRHNGIDTHTKGMSGNKNVDGSDVVKTEQPQELQAERNDGDISPATEDTENEETSIPEEKEEESEEEERKSEKKGRETRKKNKNQDDVKTGRWSGAEDQKLKNNMEQFCKECKINNKRKLLFPTEYNDRAKLKQFIKDFDFYEELGKGLSRTHDSVYMRARKLFDTRHYKGRWTDEDLDELRRLHAVHGNKWRVIGEAMKRSSRSVNDKYRQLKHSRVTGPWTAAEKAQLKKAVEEAVESDAGDNAYYNIPWTKVAEKVPTRNFTQCRKEWLVHTQQCRKKQTSAWSKADSIELIERIYASKVKDESEIDWLKLHAQHFPSEASPQSLKARWTNLKRNYIPQYSFKSFEEIIDKLHEYVMPWLRKQTPRTPGLLKSKPSTARKKIRKKLNGAQAPEDTISDPPEGVVIFEFAGEA